MPVIGIGSGRALLNVNEFTLGVSPQTPVLLVQPIPRQDFQKGFFHPTRHLVIDIRRCFFFFFFFFFFFRVAPMAYVGSRGVG